MQMICRKCKRTMSLDELAGYACGHFANLLLAAGLAAYLGQKIHDYFSNPTRGFIDGSMAGACNGFKMACPQCKKTNCWDPFPEINQKQTDEEKGDKKITVIAAKGL